MKVMTSTLAREPLRDYNFGLRTVATNVSVISALFLINYLGPVGNLGFFVALMAMSLKSAEQTVRALTILYLVIVGNTAIVSTGGMIFGVGKFLLLFVFFGRLLYSISRQGRSVYDIPLLSPLILFCVVAFLLALEGGYFVQISALKLVSFAVGVACVFTAVEAVRYRPHRLDSWFFSIAIFVVLLGLFTWIMGLGFNAKTDLGYSSGLFNGPFYHPQTMGPAAAMILLWLISFGLLSKYQARVWAFALVPFFVVFLYLSSSRTSLLAIGLAVLAIILGAAIMRGQASRLIKRLLRWGFLAVMALGFLMTVVEIARPGAVVEPAIGFIVKSNRNEGSGDSIQANDILYSRESLIDMMTKNIDENPWTGIGFGTSTRPGFGTGDSVFRAPTEKGILPIAVVEENGYIGAFFFVVFLLAVFAHLTRTRNITGLMAFAGLLGLNLTEMNFFSFGGQGGFFWIWVMASMLLMPATKSHLETRQSATRKPSTLARSA